MTLTTIFVLSQIAVAQPPSIVARPPSTIVLRHACETNTYAFDKQSIPEAQFLLTYELPLDTGMCIESNGKQCRPIDVPGTDQFFASRLERVLLLQAALLAWQVVEYSEVTAPIIDKAVYLLRFEEERSRRVLLSLRHRSVKPLLESYQGLDVEASCRSTVESMTEAASPTDWYHALMYQWGNCFNGLVKAEDSKYHSTDFIDERHALLLRAGATIVERIQHDCD